MPDSVDFIWNSGEKNRQLAVYRPCPCGTCSIARKGIGYLSFSDAKGEGFTIWLANEEVFERLNGALSSAVKDGGCDTRQILWVQIAEGDEQFCGDGCDGKKDKEKLALSVGGDVSALESVPKAPDEAKQQRHSSGEDYPGIR
jgi:hypothetical protein